VAIVGTTYHLYRYTPCLQHVVWVNIVPIGGLMKLSRCAVACLLVWAILLIAPGTTRAQQGSAKIEGRVSDSQQLALAQAVVELKTAQGNTVQKTVADGTGHYEFTDVPAGTYTLTMMRSGFSDEQQGPVTVAAGQSLVLDATLKPLPVFETLTVVAENDHLVASKTEIPLRDLPFTDSTVPR
jgi:hypothetical protein